MTAVAVTTSPRSRLRHVDFVVLALYWVAIGYLWQSLGTLILPGMVQDLVGPADKGKARSSARRSTSEKAEHQNGKRRDERRAG